MLRLGRLKFLVLQIVIAISFVGCCLFNAIPMIQNAFSSRVEILVDEKITISCEAIDGDDDPLSYAWGTDRGGTFASQANTIPEVEWTAPSDPGPVTITVTVSDKCPDTDWREIYINVHLPDEPPADFKAESTSTGIVLTWTNPIIYTFEQVIIRGKTGSFPIDETDGRDVYKGTNVQFTDKDAVAESLNYYRIWAKHSTGMSEPESASDQFSPPVDAPAFSPTGDTYASAQSVTISCTTSGASIRYTLNGDDPTETYGNSINSGSSVTISSTSTLKAIAYKTGRTTSGVTSAVYTIEPPVDAPTFSPTGGTYTSTQSVTISCTTSGASIRYTLTGNDPTETYGTSINTGSSVTISSTSTLKAIAYKTGWTTSGVTSATYTIEPPADAPTFSPTGGTYTGTQSVTIELTHKLNL